MASGSGVTCLDGSAHRNHDHARTLGGGDLGKSEKRDG
jgi:hypothetical protein